MRVTLIPHILIIRCGKMTALGFFVLIAITVHATTGQAPGDVDQVCLTTPTRPSVVNQDLLMASFDYRDLIVNGGPWAVVDRDDNNNPVSGSPTPTVCLKIKCRWCVCIILFACSGRNLELLVTE